MTPQSFANERQRWIALYVLCTGVLMIVLDVTVVNVALPSIQEDLGFSAAGLAWVVNAYLIAFGGLLLLAGRLGDLIGRRTVFLAGLAVFTCASLVCGLAQSQGMLVAARASLPSPQPGSARSRRRTRSRSASRPTFSASSPRATRRR